MPKGPRFGTHLKSSRTITSAQCEILYIHAEGYMLVGSDSHMMPFSAACQVGAGSGTLIAWNAVLTVEHVGVNDITVTPGRWSPGDADYAPFGAYRCALLGVKKWCR